MGKQQGVTDEAEQKPRKFKHKKTDGLARVTPKDPPTNQDSKQVNMHKNTTGEKVLKNKLGKKGKTWKGKRKQSEIKQSSQSKREGKGAAIQGEDGERPANKKRKHDNKGDTTQGEDSTQLPANKKRRLKMERQKTKPHFELVAELNRLWNRLREHTLKPSERRKLVDELMTMIRGRIMAVALKHDASRSVQAAIQFGTDEHRDTILQEVEGRLHELCTVTYAHFVVLKLVKYLSRHQRQRLCQKGIKGHVVRLARHAVGAKVLEAVFLDLPSAFTAPLRLELYGRQFALFAGHDHASARDQEEARGKGKGGPGAGGRPKQLRSLADVVERFPEQREEVLQNMSRLVEQLHQKGNLQYAFAHHIVWEFLQQAGPGSPQAVLGKAQMGNLIEATMVMLTTRLGAKCMAWCINQGAAKERKQVMKQLRGHVVPTLLHRDGYLGVLGLVAAVDDTVGVQKVVLQEILRPPPDQPDLLPGYEPLATSDGETLPMLLQVALSKGGSRVLLHLLAATRTKYFDQAELAVVDPPEGRPNSRKDPDQRRKELYAFLREPLVEICREHTEHLIRSVHGECVLLEVYRYERESGEEDSVQGLVQAIVEVAVAPPPQRVEEEEQEQEEDSEKEEDGEGGEGGAKKGNQEPPQAPIYEDSKAHRFFQRILALEAGKQEEGKSGGAPGQQGGGKEPPGKAPLAEALAEALSIRDEGAALQNWVGCNRGAFAVASLVGVPGLSRPVKKHLQVKVQELKGSIPDSRGKEALLQAIV